ncbi:putative homing endonuclease [Vibrio phage 424E50-1]|nr:putative homing endonuclease [Vibrio phage 424E50-1]
MKNNKTSNTWNTTDINKLFLGRGDPSEKGKEASERLSLPLEVVSERLLKSGKFLEGTIFCQSNVPKVCLYKCPKCSSDEYVKSGLCSGVFKTHYNKTDGSLSCRCSKACRWTKEQRQLQIQMLMDKEEEFLHWHTEPSARQKFFWICKEGHRSKTAVLDFIHGGNRCRKCATHGYSTDNNGWFYLVRWFTEDFSILKYGITNKAEVEMRIKDQSKGTMLKYDILLSRRFADGTTSLEIENLVKSRFGVKGVCGKEIFKDGFTETIEDCKENLDFIRNLAEACPNL